MNTREFILRGTARNLNKYDYSLVEYKHSQKKVTIICKEHGKFRQRAGAHLHGKEGCKMCMKLRQVELGLRLPLL